MIVLDTPNGKILPSEEEVRSEGIFFPCPKQKKRFSLPFPWSVLTVPLAASLWLVPDFSLTIQVSTTLFCFFSLLIPIFLKKKLSPGLLLDRFGVTFVDIHYQLLFPWSSLPTTSPFFIDNEGRLSFYLTSSLPGVGYIVQRAPRKGIFSDTFLLQHNTFHTSLPLLYGKKHVVSFVNQTRLLFPTPSLCHDTKIDLHGSDFSHQQVRFPRLASLSYPSFCPISGDPCDITQSISLPFSTRNVFWSLSKKGISSMKQQALLRLASLVIATGAYLLLGYFVSFYLRVPLLSTTFLLYMALSLLCYILVPLVWIITKPRFWILAQEDALLATIADEEYFQAFVERNVAKEEALPWRTEEGAPLSFLVNT